MPNYRIKHWEQGWPKGDSARLPLIWPGLESETRRHMWIEFIVDTRPYSKDFPPDFPVFLSLSKSLHFQIQFNLACVPDYSKPYRYARRLTHFKMQLLYRMLPVIPSVNLI